MGALADGCAAWLHDGSRVSGDVQARFCESLGVRFPGATHLVAGFENCGDAERFLQEWKDRLQKFGLELHPDKTRLIEFGRHAAENRKQRGEGKPEVFDFLGFTHMCGTTRKTGRFIVKRKTIRNRLSGTRLRYVGGLRQPVEEYVSLARALTA